MFHLDAARSIGFAGLMSTDYDALYRTTPDALGAPTPDLARFLEAALTPPARVLDIGCGQGHDALFLARLGHRVTGVDLSPAGIASLNDAARRDGLSVTGTVADVTAHTPSEAYDLLLFDRILHRLAARDRIATLLRLTPALVPGVSSPSSMNRVILQAISMRSAPLPLGKL